MTNITISNEDELFNLLEELISKTVDLGEIQLEFSGFPRYQVTIDGDDFKGGIPTRIMPALLSTQKAIEQAYARFKYGKVRNLSREEKKQVELIVNIKDGSTIFDVDLSKAFNDIMPLAKSMVDKMSGGQIAISIAAIAATITGAFAWKYYLSHKTEINASEQETRRMKIVTEAMSQVSEIAQKQIVSQNDMFSSLLKKLEPNDKIIDSDGKEIIDGRTAQEVLRMPKFDVVESRLDGEFIIDSVDSGKVMGCFKLHIRDVENTLNLAVKVPEGTLKPEQITILQKGEWEKKPLKMMINTKKKGDRIIEATLVEAGLK